MCRKNEVDIAVLFNLCYFYYGIQSNKTHNFFHDKAFEVQHEICQFK